MDAREADKSCGCCLKLFHTIPFFAPRGSSRSQPIERFHTHPRLTHTTGVKVLRTVLVEWNLLKTENWRRSKYVNVCHLLTPEENDSMICAERTLRRKRKAVIRRFE